jgi:tRNA threonylcarbamoyladenosine biosynthesis protein TsaB
MAHLVIDTSSEQTVLALVTQERIVWQHFFPIGSTYASRVPLELKRAFDDRLLSWEQVEGIVVGNGPGSYTGLRLGMAIAKTLAYAKDLPLRALSSLKALVPDTAPTLFVSLIDARSGGIYAAKGYREEGKLEWRQEPQLLAPSELAYFCEGAQQVLSPCILPLQQKWAQLGLSSIQWQEKAPCPLQLAAQALHQCPPYFAKDNFAPIELHYLRKTQAEMERQAKTGLD